MSIFRSSPRPFVGFIRVALFSKSIGVMSSVTLREKQLEKLEDIESEITIKRSSDPNAPMIFLFGWAGCRDRYLSKYSQIYEGHNYSVLRFTAPIAKIKCYSSYRRFALEVFDKALNLNASELNFPIFFHVFSMNGCSLFSSLWDFISDSSNGEAVKKMVGGIIFDSCPANVMPWQGADAISFATMPPTKYSNLQRASYRWFLTGVLSIHRAIVWLRSNFEHDIYEQHFSYFHMLKCATEMPIRQLYLFSTADTICSAASIEHFQHVQLQRKNVVLFSKCWNDSSHVEHLRKYTQEYTAECLRFIEGGIESALCNNNMGNLNGSTTNEFTKSTEKDSQILTEGDKNS